MKKRIKNGFTLIELLTTILILVLVLSISGYVVVNVINNTKEKNYNISINNIEGEVDEYLVENADRLFYLKDEENKDIEYQCVTVKNLIDMGYFDDDIINTEIGKNRKVSKEDYVYIERSINNKTILSSVMIAKYYNKDNEKYNKYAKICGVAVTALGDIRFSVNPDEWSLEKEVKVYYLLSNLNDYNKLDNYTYNLSESDDTSSNEKSVIIDSNRTINANIKNKEEVIVSKELIIDKIDREGPKVSFVSDEDKFVSKEVIVSLLVTDFGIGADLSSFTKEDLDVTIGGNSVLVSSFGCDSSGKCNIVVKNEEYDGDLVIKINAGLISDKLGNKNEEIILNSGIKFDNTAPVITLGTNGNSTYSKSASSKITVSDDGIGGDISTYKYIYAISNSATPSTIFTSGSSYLKDGVSGDYYLVVRACDKLNNCTTKVSNVFKLDNTGPTITISSDLTKIYGQSFDLFEGVTVSDNVGMISSKKVYLGNTEVTSYSDLSVGTNTVTYKAKDNLGNESSKTRIISLAVSSKEFNYQESEQSYTIVASGTYIIEAYGAQGGNGGGKGGYVKAEAYLTAGTTIYVKTGGINGYNGGGAYGVSGYYPGGGATTVKYNNTNIVIAAGGGAKGPSGTGGSGGSGDGTGGSDVGSGAGKSGSNGGGGSSSQSHSFSCYCKTCGGGCAKTKTVIVGCKGTVQQDDECHGGYITEEKCIQWYNTWQCNCSTCTDSGKSGTGGSNKVISPASSVSTASGSRSGNGYAKISYKMG